MQDKHTQDAGRLVDSHVDRLLRDLIAIGHVESKRSPAAERLTAKLGEDLLRALLAELDRFDSGALPIRSRAGFANSGGLVCVDESSEQIASAKVGRRC